MPSSNFLAGAATRIITPRLDKQPVFLAGFAGNRRATAVHSDLYARALGLRLDEQAFVLVACDLIGLGRPDVEDIRAALAAHAIETELVVACTHTRAGPDTIGLWGPEPAVSGVSPTYLATLKQAVVEAAVEALTFCCPVELRAAATAPHSSTGDDGTPGLVYDELVALQFEKPDGEVVATLLNLVGHPEVPAGDSYAISAGYAGAACQVVEAAAGGTALHVSGALGGPIGPAIGRRDVEDVAAIGRAYAETALAALAQTPLSSVERLEVRRAIFDLPLSHPIDAGAPGLRLAGRRAEQTSKVTTTCAYVDLGAAQLITVPGRLPPLQGLELKAALPGPYRLVIGLSDDELGSILSNDAFVMPADRLNPGRLQQESDSLDPHSASLVLAAAKELVKRKT